jgi:SAM-dependent methyltransferase
VAGEKNPGEKAYIDLMQGTLDMAEACAKEERPYMHEVCGKDFVVMPSVFSPKYFRDTEFFAREVPKRAGSNFLEIGTGTGIVACCAKLHGYAGGYAGRITAIDINPQAVANAKINALLHRIDEDFEVLQGSVYEPLGYRQFAFFDTIFWNIPFGDWEVEVPDDLTRSVFDPGQKNLREFILGAQRHLFTEKVGRMTGNLLIGYSTTLGKHDVLAELLDEAGFAPPEIVAETGYVRDGNPRRPVDFKLFEARRK